MYRTHTCGELREEHIGQDVQLAGWLSSIRDLGSVVFLNIRDFYGTTQIIVVDEKLMEVVRKINKESTIKVKGTVVRRSSPNAKIPTGQIEIKPYTITLLGNCNGSLPFEILNSNESREDTRLKYRFLDLRNPINRDKIILRSKVINSIRNIMIQKGFYEIQTPILTASSPEGARDYIVPSRVHPGQFYALPQAPQQFKQLLMVSGFDKYFQIAPCFRDEDARADRSPGEFYQLDMEMAFAEQEDIFCIMEEVLSEIFSEFSDWSINVPFPRIPYNESIDKYGTDKPDLRNPLIIQDTTKQFQKMTIEFMKNKIVKSIVVHDFNESRKFIDSIVRQAQEIGCKSVAWLRLNDSQELVGSILKYLDDSSKQEIIHTLGLKKNSIAFFLADEKKEVIKYAGLMRMEIGQRLGLVEDNSFKFCWIVDFPMYEKNEETGKIEFSHNPFSMPQGGLEALNTKNYSEILAYQYDIVCNGIELSSGAVRNHDIEVMLKAFQIAGYTEQDIKNKFSALYNAFQFGAPPHAGIAPGVDRIVMLLANEPNIREVIAFPMNKSAQDLLMGAPSVISKKQLDDANIEIKSKKVM